MSKFELGKKTKQEGIIYETGKIGGRVFYFFIGKLWCIMKFSFSSRRNIEIQSSCQIYTVYYIGIFST